MLKLFKHDSALNEIRESLPKTRRLAGVFNGHAWEVVIGKPCGDGVFQVLGPGAWRKNETNSLFCCWQTDMLLDDYLHKKTINSDTVRFNIAEYEKRNPTCKKNNISLYNQQTKQIELQVPFSPLELRHSAIFCMDFDLKQVEYYVQLEHDKYLFMSGNLPLKQIIIAPWERLWRSEPQPVLRIVFQQYHAKP
jgi:hypothetical protein